ncbi:hypothetical protein C5748_26365 [Phyllobacterium phragmitis]|uniref:Uncharacterized protein n=1 Tax=Phyllobacterium phragmitis TaxID=2670329 RepID=A0A2S9IJ61_9HYPH|nr:hypothetical protein C5748_26365 [Phyllobacterium phragmitis]
MSKAEVKCDCSGTLLPIAGISSPSIRSIHDLLDGAFQPKSTCRQGGARRVVLTPRTSFPTARKCDPRLWRNDKSLLNQGKKLRAARRTAFVVCTRPQFRAPDLVAFSAWGGKWIWPL